MLRLPPQTYNTTTTIPRTSWLSLVPLVIPHPDFSKPALSIWILHHPRHLISLIYLALRRGTLRLGSQTNRLLIRIQEAIVGKFPNSQLLNLHNSACWLCHWLLIRKHLLLTVLRILIPTHLSPTGGPPILDSQPASNHLDYMTHLIYMLCNLHVIFYTIYMLCVIQYKLLVYMLCNSHLTCHI